MGKQVKDLEEEIGVRLLDRVVSVALTNAGEVFLEDSRRLLHEARRAVERAHETHAGHRGKLRIGSVGIIATDFLPKTLKIFHQEFPGVEVEFVEMLPAEQLDALASGKIDIGFAYGKEVANLPNLRSLCVIHSVFGIAVSFQHPLAKRAGVTLKELRSETLLCLGGGGRSSHREAICKIYSAEGFKPVKHRTIEGFDSMVTLIAADQGISILPHVLDLGKQGITIIPIHSAKADLDFHMWAVWQGHSPSPHIKHFIRLLEERVRGNAKQSQGGGLIEIAAAS